MSQSGSSSPVSTEDALRIVLFGLPAAGKSSLLGALAQSARLQENLLNGRLTDLTHGLDELRIRLYEQGNQQTKEEVVPYSVDFEPFTNHQHLNAIVIDCDGRVANDLLVRRKTLDESSPKGTLACEVLRAGALVLVVDVTAPSNQIDADFAEFDRFLRLFEEGRGERTEVGGLPIFLVLTKCDLLAAPDDTVGTWMEKIEQHKRDTGTHFQNFLARRSTSDESLPFGQIDLHLWATAVKRPALARTPTKDREPFGVAELFRQCLEQAAVHRLRTKQSDQRLFRFASTAVGVATAMLLLIIGFAIVNRETPVNELRAKIENLRSTEKSTPADRLQGMPGELSRRLAVFTALRDDPAFPELSDADRYYVHSRIEELKEYIDYYGKLLQVRRPGDVASIETLRQITGELKALAPPREEWSETDAGRLHADRLAEADGLRQAVTRVKDWYNNNLDKGRDLWTFAHYQPTTETPAIDWRRWYDAAVRFLDTVKVPPFSEQEPIPDTSLTYATALRFDAVIEARVEFETIKDKLKQILDVSAALGLVGEVKDRPALLVIPRPPDFSLDRARIRLKELQKTYPHYQTEFILAGLPDTMVPAVRQAARNNYEYLLDPGREAVLHQLQTSGSGDEETPARWAKVVSWLTSNPEELAAWRTLAVILARLNDAEAADPVSVLTSFLQKTTFPIDINRLTLEVPFSYTDVKPEAGADLTIYHSAASPDQPAIVCKPFGEGKRDDIRKLTIYEYRPQEQQRLIYHPGDALWATLSLRNDQTLTWIRSHSIVYQFERLVRPPRLHKANEPSSAGTLADGIQLIVVPADGVPRVPDLLPVVRLAK